MFATLAINICKEPYIYKQTWHLHFGFTENFDDWRVVREMGILEQSSNFQNCIKKTNKIPEYAGDYRNEYLFIRGIDKALDDFTTKYLLHTSELFVSSYSNRIKFFIRKFLKAQELGYLTDINWFTLKECDVKNICFLFKMMHCYFVEDKEVREDGNDDFYSVDIPGYRDFYVLFCKYYDKINDGFIESESESESEIEYDADSD